jgi:hypothetical protein
MPGQIEWLRRASIACALITPVLVLAGCETARYQTAAGPEVAVTEPPPAKELAAPPPGPAPNTKSAEAGKRSVKVAAVNRSAPPSAARLDEAGCTGVDACASVLKAMIADPARGWMRRPAPPAVLANGVRLFAYRALRPSLTCPELATASSEIEAGDAALKRGVAGLSSDQVDRARTLTVEVGQELQAEAARRCSPVSKGGVVGAATRDRQYGARAIQ